MDNAQLDAYVAQLKQMGLDDATVEIYKQQYIQSMQLSAQMMNSDMMQQMMQMGQQMAQQMGQMAQQMGQQLTGNDMDMAQLSQLLGDDEPEVDEHTTLTIPQQWAIACGANLAFYNDSVLNTLKTGMDAETTKAQLSEWWGVESRDELIETFDYLGDGGHRDRFNLIAQAYSLSDADAAANFFEEKLATVMDEEDAVKYMQNMREAMELFGNDGLLPKGFKVPNMMAWDFVRIINLCRNGFDAGYLTEEEALNAITTAAQAIQEEYGSWKELSVGYLFARCIWGGCEDYDSWKEGMDMLLNHKDSPWVKLPWNTKLQA